MKVYSIRIFRKQSKLSEDESPFTSSSPLCQEMPYFFYRYGVVYRYEDKRDGSIYLGFLSKEDQEGFVNALNTEAKSLFKKEVDLKVYPRKGEVSESLVRVRYEA